MNKKWKRISFCLITMLFVGICVGKMKFDAYATDAAVVGDANDDDTFNIQDLTRVKKYTVSTDVVDINATNADLNNDTEINSTDLQHCREFLVKGYSVVTGTYAYDSGTYEDGTLTNTEDTVAVKMGTIGADDSMDINATVDSTSRTFAAVVANGTHDVTLSSRYFYNVTVSSGEVNTDTEVETATFKMPKVTPDTNLSWLNLEDDKLQYYVNGGVAISPVEMKADAGFTATVNMNTYASATGYGNVGVKVNDKTFYIITRVDNADNNKISLYVADKIVKGSEVKTQTLLGDTGQTLLGELGATICTMQLSYLDGVYYVSLSAEGCTADSKVLEINQTTSGLGDEYFGEGERTLVLASLDDRMISYGNLSYTLGEFEKVTGSYTYTSGTYEGGKLTNVTDSVDVKIGNYKVTATVNKETQTYEAVMPVGTHNVTLSSSRFVDVIIPDVTVSSTDTTVANATFIVPKMENGNFDYSNYTSSGNHYYVWTGNDISTVGMEADADFTATISMHPYDAVNGRGNVGVKIAYDKEGTIEYKTLYIMARVNPSDGNKISLYVADKIVTGAQVANAEYTTALGYTGQSLPTNYTEKTKCTMQLSYLNGVYYVSLSAEGCTADPKVLTIDQTTSGLGNEYFGEGTRTLVLASLTDRAMYYSDLSYTLGDLAKVTGSYAYTSGTYEEGKLTNATDSVNVKIGNYKATATVNKETQTYEAVMPVGTHNVTLSSSYFYDVTVSSVAVKDNTEIDTATFKFPTVTPYSNLQWLDLTNEKLQYYVNSAVAVSPKGMTANKGFTATVNMKTNADATGYGNVGVKVGDKTFYIMTRVDGDGNIKLYVADKIVTGTQVASQTLLGEPGQTLQGGYSSGKICTMQLSYLNGVYYVSLSAEGCTSTPTILTIKKEDQKIGEEFFVEGERTLVLASLDDRMICYGNLIYQLGDDAAKAALTALGVEY